MKLYQHKPSHQNFDDVEPLMSADATFWFSDGTYSGLKEIRSAFKKTWQELRNEIYWMEDIDWVALSDTAPVASTALTGERKSTGRLARVMEEA